MVRRPAQQPITPSATKKLLDEQTGVILSSVDEKLTVTETRILSDVEEKLAQSEARVNAK